MKLNINNFVYIFFSVESNRRRERVCAAWEHFSQPKKQRNKKNEEENENNLHILWKCIC